MHALFSSISRKRIIVHGNGLDTDSEMNESMLAIINDHKQTGLFIQGYVRENANRPSLSTGHVESEKRYLLFMCTPIPFAPTIDTRQEFTPSHRTFHPSFLPSFYPIDPISANCLAMALICCIVREWSCIPQARSTTHQPRYVF